MPRRTLTLQWLSALLACLLCAGVVRADRIVTGSATAQPDGSYLYQYTVNNTSRFILNPDGSGNQFFNFSLKGPFNMDFQNVMQPNGWSSFTEPGTVGWYALGRPATIGKGQSGVFSFTSRQAAGTSQYAVLGVYFTYPLDPSAPTAAFYGSVVGPGGEPFGAPEPGLAVLLTSAGGVLLLRRWRRRTAGELDGMVG
jgi:hypothetical protein